MAFFISVDPLPSTITIGFGLRAELKYIALIYLAISVCHILFPHRSPPAVPSVLSIVGYLRDQPATFPSSNASCDVIPNTMMLSRGFASRCADSESILLESNRFREAILGSGHTFKNAEEFQNAIYQMSLGGRFEYKYKKNSPTDMSMKCSVEGCPWKIKAHAVDGNAKGNQPDTIVEYTSHEAIDPCHLSGPYKGALLSAISYDADNGMFSLALGVENFSSFLNKQNNIGKKGKEDVLLLLDNIAYARLDIDYNEVEAYNNNFILQWPLRSYDLTTADVGLVFGLSTTGRFLQIAITPSDYPFGTLNTCEERLLNLPIGEEFRKCFLYYACATILVPTSRIDGCRKLWHTIHEDGFRNDVSWDQFVVDQLVEISSVHVPMTVPLLSAWSDELIKQRLVAKISEFGSFGHGEEFNDSSPPRTYVEAENRLTSSHEILEQYYAAECAIKAYQKGIQQQLGIMHGLMHILDAQIERSEWEATTSASDGSQSIVTIHSATTNPTVCHKDGPKQATTIVFDGDFDPSDNEELVAMHDTSLSRDNLASFQGDNWIGNDVVDAYCRMFLFEDISRTKLFLSPYIAEMVMRYNAKHLTQDAVIARFKPYLYPLDVSYQNVNEVYLPVLVQNHWTFYVYDLQNKRIQLLDSRPGRKRSCMSGIQQNLTKVVLWLVTYKKEMVDIDFKMFCFVMPDIPC
ncbi:hypothetical protein CK203_049815 [Vitis vinifera]|uniref:Ubiquitin-like protease family profile domain-containing protein n=1 Tax=Vitis vinifera TaxID=29760 RepID=A0A438H1R6_VITVI|nr:hypothetical protein CK203_049815 [Vitis vinifera]